MMRLSSVLYWLGTIIWAVAIGSAAIAAMHAFPTLREMPMTVDAYAGYDGEPHGLLAAGHVMRGVFDTTDRLQLGAAVAALLGGTGMLLAGRRFTDLLRAALLAGAVALFGWYFTAVRPPMQSLLDAKWEAAAAGDEIAAGEATEAFELLHVRSERLHGAILLCVLAGAAVSAAATAPARPGGRGGDGA